MAVRRQATRIAAVCVMLGGLVAVGASPALADGDSVRVRAASAFTPGGSPGAVSLEVRRRSEGCVMVRSTLGLRLAGLAADQVSVQFPTGGRWWPVPTGGAGGVVSTQQVTPANPTLCKGRSVTMRYRVAFHPGAPAGRLTVVGEATNARGQTLGRDATAARVAEGRRTPSPSPTPSRRPSPTVAPTEEARPDAGPTLAAFGGQAGAASTLAAEEGSGGSSLFMLVGLGLVVVGAGLIVLLVRRSRVDREQADGGGHHQGVPQPRGPGGTTYRAGAGAPPYAGGAPSGGVYGRPAGTPSGSVYGARPATPVTPPAGGSVYGGGTTYPAQGGATPAGGGTTYPAGGVPPRQDGPGRGPRRGTRRPRAVGRRPARSPVRRPARSPVRRPPGRTTRRRRRAATRRRSCPGCPTDPGRGGALRYAQVR
ncbi:hypothetical protein JD77_03538 [Micromonospora olivasterospora]|uniref:Uncharacterized protein n=2 Tax=Micromonospora olivasterospora TaxID=1880 RepID=A0A562ICV7_MICOL|nr:hypothetical protein JD77_03538 [Micromonospora olivasterospora]